MLPTTDVTSYQKDEGAYVTLALSTFDIEKVGLIHSSHPGLITGLTDIRTKLDQLIAAYGEEDVRG